MQQSISEKIVNNMRKGKLIEILDKDDQDFEKEMILK